MPSNLELVLSVRAAEACILPSVPVFTGSLCPTLSHPTRILSCSLGTIDGTYHFTQERSILATAKEATFFPKHLPSDKAQ